MNNPILELLEISKELAAILVDTQREEPEVFKLQVKLIENNIGFALEEISRELKELKRLRDMYAQATVIQGDDEVLRYVKSGNSIPVDRCTVSADLIRQLVADRSAQN